MKRNAASGLCTKPSHLYYNNGYVIIPAFPDGCLHQRVASGLRRCAFDQYGLDFMIGYKTMKTIRAEKKKVSAPDILHPGKYGSQIIIASKGLG
jgi:hypothetical protein